MHVRRPTVVLTDRNAPSFFSSPLSCQGVTERFVTVPEEILEAIEEGKANRRVAITSKSTEVLRDF